MDRIRKLLGADVDRDEAIGALERLGIEVTRSAGAVDCGIPSWRPDLTIEDDIAEEVGRLALGYANLPEKISWQIGQRGQDSPKGIFLAQVRDALVRAGMQEVVTHSLVSPDAVADDALALRNPMAPEYSRLRDSLLPNLLSVASRAHREGIRDLSLFEVGPIYQKSGEAGIVEPLRIAGLVSGSGLGGVWSAKGDAYPADFYYARGVVDALLFALGIAGLELEPTSHRLLHGYRAARLSIGGRCVGTLGELSRETVNREDVPARACVFDLDGDALRELASARAGLSVPPPRFPAAVRDLAPVFPESVPWSAIERSLAACGEPLLESFVLTDVYAGEGLGAGRRALTIRLTLRSPGGTLTESQIQDVVGTIRATLTRQGGEFRS